jgi:hypothetical protein
VFAVLLLASLAAQAEPAPVQEPAAPMPAIPPEPPPVPEPSPPVLRNALGVSIQLGHRLAEGGASLDPYWGFSLSGRYERRLLAAPSGLELGVAADFSFQRFATSVVGSTMISPGVEMTFDGTRLITETTFAILPTVALQAGPVRPFVSAGVGLGVGFFSSPEVDLRPGSETAVQPLLRGSVGVDVMISPTAAVTARVDYSHTFTRPTFVTDAGQRYSLFGDLLDLGLGLLLRF